MDLCLLALNAMLLAKVHEALNGVDVLVILVRGIVAADVHVEGGTFLDHRQADASGTDHGDRLAGDFVAQERQIGMPESPLLVADEAFTAPESPGECAHDKEGEFCGGFGEDIGRMSERNLVAVGVGAIDVVEAYRNLRYDPKRMLAGFEDFGVDSIAKRGDQTVDSRTELCRG